MGSETFPPWQIESRGLRLLQSTSEPLSSIKSVTLKHAFSAGQEMKLITPLSGTSHLPAAGINLPRGAGRWVLFN